MTCPILWDGYPSIAGKRIIEAILRGERDFNKLAELKGPQFKNDKNTIAKALQRDYREEHLFSLKQEVDSYNFYQTKIAECDTQIEQFYLQIDSKINPDEKPMACVICMSILELG